MTTALPIPLGEVARFLLPATYTARAAFWADPETLVVQFEDRELRCHPRTRDELVELLGADRAGEVIRGWEVRTVGCDYAGLWLIFSDHTEAVEHDPEALRRVVRQLMQPRPQPVAAAA